MVVLVEGFAHRVQAVQEVQAVEVGEVRVGGEVPAWGG